MNDFAPMRQLSPVTQPISPAKFAHFVLRTGQFEIMAQVVSNRPRGASGVPRRAPVLPRYDDEHHRLALIHIRASRCVIPMAGTHRVAYAYNDLGELRRPIAG